MTLIVTDLDGGNPPIEIAAKLVRIKNQGSGYLEIMEIDRGVSVQVLTAPRAVEIKVVP